MHLTNKSVATLQASDPRGIRVWDDELVGFAAAVFPGPKRGKGKPGPPRITWEIRYRVAGMRKRYSFARYPQLTVAQAREMAQKLLGRVANGEDPAEQRDRERGTPTFSAWRTTYLSRLQGRRVSLSDTKHYLTVASEKWGGKRLDTLTRTDVEILYQAIGEKHPTTANRWLAAVSACLSMAVREGLIPKNPAANLSKFKEAPPRARVLTGDEMQALVTAVQSEDEHTRAAFGLLIGCGLRLSETLRARWEDYNKDEGTLRLPRPKSGRAEFVPLPTSIRATLDKLSVHGEYIVAGEDPKKPRYDIKGAWRRVINGAKREEALERKKRGEDPSKGFLENVHIHDLRRSFGLAVARQSGLHVASKLLRHRDIRITQSVYSPLDMDLLRDAVEKRQDALPFGKRKGGR
jgi:integrase